jgi:hypothetical protein
MFKDNRSNFAKHPIIATALAIAAGSSALTGCVTDHEMNKWQHVFEVNYDACAKPLSRDMTEAGVPEDKIASQIRQQCDAIARSKADLAVQNS